jgi:fumarylpyruvate hydrolase
MCTQAGIVGTTQMRGMIVLSAMRRLRTPLTLSLALTEQSAVVSTITHAKDFRVTDQKISLAVNGATKQDAKLSDLVWSVEELVSHLSHYYHLVPGDLIFTGTPAGVGPVVTGDKIEGTITGLSPVTLTIGAAE